MQTFLPYPDFVRSAECLDWKRLGKQRVEAMQLYNVITATDDKKMGWKNHPAAKMWRGHEAALALYHDVMINEWISRGYKNSMELLLPKNHHRQTIVMPKWLGDDAFHASHRSNLLRKDATYYLQFNWTEPDNLPYIWPVT